MKVEPTPPCRHGTKGRTEVGALRNTPPTLASINFEPRETGCPTLQDLVIFHRPALSPLSFNLDSSSDWLKLGAQRLGTSVSDWPVLSRMGHMGEDVSRQFRLDGYIPPPARFLLPGSELSEPFESCRTVLGSDGT